MRVLTVSDGFSSSSAPSAGSVAQNALAVYATDAAFVTAKGSAAAEGDAYYNSTYDLARVYQNSAWRFLTGQLPSFATAADYVTAKGSAAGNGDAFYNSTTHKVNIYQNGTWRIVYPGAEETHATEAAFVSAKGAAAAAGDVFIDTTYNERKYYANSKWNSVPNLNPNQFINGNFDFWQRGTSFASAADGQYAADRWAYFKTASSAVHTVSRSTDVPTLAESGFQSSYSLLADCTTADAAVAAGDFVVLRQALEGYDWARLKGKTVTLTFWVKATKTGTYCVSFRNNGNDRSYVAEYTVSVTDTWEKKTITLTLNPSGGTDDYTTGVGLRISWALMAGSTFQTTAGSWQTGNFLATSSQVNATDDTANNFRLAQVKLEVGSNSTPFSRCGETIAEELAKCQRYYEKSYANGTAPGTASTTAGALYFHNVKSTGSGHFIKFSVKKRIAPTVVYYSSNDGATGNFYDVTSSLNRSVSSENVGEGSNSFVTTATNAYVANAGDVLSGHFTADAEL